MSNFDPLKFAMRQMRRQQQQQTPPIVETALSSKEGAYSSLGMGKGSSLGNRNSARMGSLMSVDDKFNKPTTSDMLGAVRARRFSGMAGGIGGKY